MFFLFGNDFHFFFFFQTKKKISIFFLNKEMVKTGFLFFIYRIFKGIFLKTPSHLEKSIKINSQYTLFLYIFPFKYTSGTSNMGTQSQEIRELASISIFVVKIVERLNSRQTNINSPNTKSNVNLTSI